MTNIQSALARMVAAFKPFTMKPIGAPGSVARAEQGEQIAAHAEAREALAADAGDAIHAALVNAHSWFKAALDGADGEAFLNGHSNKYVGDGWAEAEKILAELEGVLPRTSTDPKR